MRRLKSGPRERELLLRISHHVGGARLRREVSTLFALEVLQSPVVLVLGLVKRGKSTLVNQILKKRLSPTGRLPETASLIAYNRSTKRDAFALATSHERHSLRRTARGFRRAVSRGKTKDLLVASFKGRVEIADGITLVDTAGADESTGGERSLVVSGAPETLLTYADAAIVVIGSPPGVSGPELEYLRRVVRAIGRDRVQLVIKSLSTEVSLQDLIDLREYIAEIEDFQIGAQNAILISDSDTESIDLVRSWINRQTKSTRYASPTAEASASVLILEQLPSLSNETEILISDEELSVLTPKLAAELRIHTPQGRIDHENAKLKAQYDLALLKYNENYLTWKSQHEALMLALSSHQKKLAESRIDSRLAVGKSVKGSVGIGCLFAILFPFSFIAFPFGPMIAFGLFVLNLGMRGDQRKELEAKTRALEAPMLSQIRNLESQLSLLAETRPTEPVEPVYLRHRTRSIRVSGRYRKSFRRLSYVTSLAAFASAAAYFLLLATLPRAPRSIELVDTTVPVVTSRVASTTPSWGLRGLVTGSKGSGLSEGEIRLVQELLVTECCPDVVIDGVWGEQTESAINQLRQTMQLAPGLGLDEQIWLSLIRRPALPSLGEDQKSTAVEGINVSRRMVLIEETLDPFPSLTQTFLLPYTPSRGAEKWLREDFQGGPGVDWSKCPAQSLSADSYRVAWISLDGRALSIWAGISAEGRDEVQIELRPAHSDEFVC